MRQCLASDIKAILSRNRIIAASQNLHPPYTKNPTDFSLLAKYGNMLSKMTEIDAAFEKWDDADMSTAEAAYYLEVNGRVLQKLAKVMG